MKKFATLALLLFTSTSFAQLTHQQKVTDFKALAGLYDKNYSPYYWEVKAFGYDLLQLQPWLDQVNASNDDLSFYDICVRYVASLQDSHDEFILPSYYEAWLPITADIYSGKVLIDGIDRTVLDPATYPFSIGDELLAVDGKSVADWVAVLGAYSVNGSGNPVSRNRLAVAIILDRYQGFYTYANKVQAGQVSSVVIRSGGKVASYAMAWESDGVLELTEEGPVPNPSASATTRAGSAQGAVARSIREAAKAARNPWGAWTGRRAAPAAVRNASMVPKAMQRHQNFGHLKPGHAVAGSIEPFGSILPAFNPPPGFQLRLGAGPNDEFLTGTFPVGNRTIGFIRIPSFEPLDYANAFAQFQQETSFFQQNTSGLVIDVMNNGGGNGCYTQNLVQYLSPKPFQALPAELRATEEWILDYESLLFAQEEAGVDENDINLVIGYIEEIEQALMQNRGLSGPVPILNPVSCYGVGGAIYPPATDESGNNIAYTKPIVLLTNNFTLSAAEVFAAELQDIKRVTVYGVRTDGGGGNVIEFDYNDGPYSEGTSRVTQSLLIRNHNISVPGLPSAPYIENFGVVPDVVADYQTKTNLLTGGQPFVNGFSSLIWSLTGRR